LVAEARERQNKMNVIFSDIDGVLNCKEIPNPRKFPYIVDIRLLARFRRLIERTGAKVVLSSTWRYDPAGLFSAKRWGFGARPFQTIGLVVASTSAGPECFVL
jgi:hypothetical protein